MLQMNDMICYTCPSFAPPLFLACVYLTLFLQPASLISILSYLSASASLWFQRSLGCSQESPFPSRGGRGAASTTTNGGRREGGASQCAHVHRTGELKSIWEKCDSNSQ